MTIEKLVHISKISNVSRRPDNVWKEALKTYNQLTGESQKLECTSHFRKVALYLFKHFNFDPNYYNPGPSGLSPAALDQIRLIVKSEIDKANTVSFISMNELRRK